MLREPLKIIFSQAYSHEVDGDGSHTPIGDDFVRQDFIIQLRVDGEVLDGGLGRTIGTSSKGLNKRDASMCSRWKSSEHKKR